MAGGSTVVHGDHNYKTRLSFGWVIEGLPPSAYYLTRVLDAAGVKPKMLRSTRLIDLVNNLDPS